MNALLGMSASPRFLESDDGLALSTTEATVLAVIGPASSLDVYFDVPRRWVSAVRLRVYGTVGSARLLLGQMDLRDVRQRTIDLRADGLAISIRGVPVESFEVTAQLLSGTEETGASFSAHTWLGKEAMGTASQARRLLGEIALPQAVTRRYAVCSPGVPTGTGAGTTSIGYLMHGTSGGRGRELVEVDKITVSYGGASTTGYLTLRIAPITAEASTPGGDEITTPAIDSADDPAATKFVHSATGAPTRGNDIVTVVLGPSSTGTFTWKRPRSGEPLVFRPGLREGVEVRAEVESGLSSEMTFTVNMEWRETEVDLLDLSSYGFDHEWRADRGVTLGTGDAVAEWRDDISGLVLTSTGTNAPDKLVDGDGIPYIDFDNANTETLDHLGQVFNPADDYTLLFVLEKTSIDGVFFDTSADTGLVQIQLRHSYPYWYFTQIADDSDYAAAYANVAAYGWHVAIFRRSGEDFTVRVDGTNGIGDSAALGETSVTRMSLGSWWASGGHNPNTPTMKVRHFAIKKGAVTDDECREIESLLASVWPSLP